MPWLYLLGPRAYVWSFRYVWLRPTIADRIGTVGGLRAAAFPIPARTGRDQSVPFPVLVSWCGWPRLPLRRCSVALRVHTSHTDYHYQ